MKKTNSEGSDVTIFFPDKVCGTDRLFVGGVNTAFIFRISLLKYLLRIKTRRQQFSYEQCISKASARGQNVLILSGY